MFLNETPQEVPQSSVRDFRLSIRLWVKCGRESKCRPHQAPESFPKIASEANVSVGKDVARDPVKAYHFIEE